MNTAPNANNSASVAHIRSEITYDGTKSAIIAQSLPAPVDFIILRCVLRTKSSQEKTYIDWTSGVNCWGDVSIEFFHHVPSSRVPSWVGRYYENEFGGCETLRQSGKEI